MRQHLLDGLAQNELVDPLTVCPIEFDEPVTFHNITTWLTEFYWIDGHSHVDIHSPLGMNFGDSFH